VARKNKLAKAGEAAWAAQGDRYMQRLLEDEELRSSLLGAYTAARSAYGRLSNGKGPTDALFHDPKLQQELIAAAAALREATGALTETSAKPKKKSAAKGRRRGPRRSLMLILVGAALAVALSEDLRSKILDMLFGAEEEFDYTSTTAPATPAPAGVAGS
jgi:hypothetical protein